MKHISILGSTGSIGRQTLEVIEQHPEDFQVVALSAGENIDLFTKQVLKWKPQIASVATKKLADELKAIVGSHTIITFGEEGLEEVATWEQADFVVTAVVGSLGLKPTISAIRAGKNIGLANKETLVSAGHLIVEEAHKNGVSIIPIDSEHSAIFQCLKGEQRDSILRIILTASGGSFRHLRREQLKDVTVKEALSHPNWKMGAKITIDSATMMNKGLEVIEAHWLFGLPFEKIDCMLHDESIIHSMVEFKDRAILAQLGTPDMKVPIQYALSYPDRMSLNTSELDLTKWSALHFRPMDFERFPLLSLAYEAGKAGGTMPTVLNSSNEVAVGAFLAGKIKFLDIERMIQEVLDKHSNIIQPSLEDIFSADHWARNYTEQLINR
ncbi:1-deoxy-D-xylulose-5-phosphate reductoisomerase [Microaerobacter geothermalis]|uniref:1-deoxy-D-xylulose-5-phosphate reductoisomerase n=1 Tax=Microaerobacter geothermalis TaxID=674972 RepID=UPI001F1B669F|nr:1-deoxy-D-xylulose-5-phosphate reductoisomerase [Microaerobacter geothermalis]MCF6093801.1 1-deoxy-D-xylulose-5-phosphate reductoisomerase [Microaerobacter geothermalis]